MAASDDLDPHPELVAVVGEGDRRVRSGPTAELQRTAAAREAGALCGQVVAPETDVMEVGVLVADPDRAGDLFQQLDARLFDRVTEGGRQDDVGSGGVAVLGGRRGARSDPR